MVSEVHSKCIKDIAAAGLSFDSVKYDTELENGEIASIILDDALGLRAAWVIYCPKKQVEIQPYIRFRQYSFSDINALQPHESISDKIHLLSIGIEGRKFKKLWGKNFELMAEVELREELAISIHLPESITDSTYITSDRYINLKTMAGLRYFAWHKNKKDITAVAKFGILKGLSSESKLGIIYGVSGEYYQKLGKKTSGKVDFYIDRFSQGYGEINMSRTEIGIRTNIIFRF